ncbi:MAG: hypothetical protein ABR582_09380 [Gemmatimonadaceae bacterium]
MVTRLISSTLCGMAAVILFACSRGNEASPTGPDIVPLYNKPSSAPSITVITLPTLGPGQSGANAINDAQEIAGFSGTFAARWSLVNGVWTATKLGSAMGSASDINEAGTVVGSSGGNIMVWRRDGSSAVVAAGWGVALNESETVVGRDGPTNRPAVWTFAAGVWTRHFLTPMAGGTSHSDPRSINNDGVVVGLSDDGTTWDHAVKWVPSVTSPGEWDAAVPLDAHAAETNSAAQAIEGQDVIGGIWRCTGPTTCTSREPYQWTLSGASAIGSLSNLDAWPNGTNSSRFIVGEIFNFSRSAYERAFVWSPAAPQLTDLGVPHGYSESSATDINNGTATRSSKQVVGIGYGSRGSQIALLWTIP